MIVNMRRKPRRGPIVDEDFRRFVRTFACIVCARGLLIREVDGWQWRYQHSRTECAHVGRRGVGQKCSDCESLPLCAFRHHSVGVYSHHTLGKRFWGFHGLDRHALITEMQRLYALEVS
jgi:hypothetical protein